MADFTPAPIKPEITFGDFEKVDIRVGLIEKVEDIEGSEKLVRLTVDLGDHKRTILAGIKKERDNPQELTNKQALFVVNLAPKPIMGEVSEGMLFGVGGEVEAFPYRLIVPEEKMPNGSRAG